ncbi:MAG TPA: VWA domain-containing protein [Candidatus Dormibacteraeota bacterium]|nr:VWA domain-containing protein [Candidatus Dormibacteraeota bacterium]
MKAESTAALGRLNLLGSAISGRAVQVAPSGPGESAWTDGTVIFVRPDASRRDQLEALAVQASLIAAGSLEPGVARRLSGRPTLTRRYLAVEGHRALAANEDLLPRPVRSLIDRHAAARADSPAASLALALGREAVADPPSSFGVIRPRRLLPSSDGRHAVAAPEAGPGRWRDDVRREHHVDAETDGPGEFPRFLSSPGAGRGALGRLLRRVLRLGREPAGGPLGAATSATTRPAPRAGRGATPATGAARTLAGMPAAGRHGRTYPEWDVDRRRYRLNWCTVTEIDPRPDNGAALVVPDGPALRRPLARLGLGLDRCHRRPQGDDVDIDAAVEARVHALAGALHDEAVYIESLRRRRDLAVLLLLDISGSSAESANEGTTVHEQQRAVAAMLALALHGLGDRVALYGFYSQGRSAVHLVRVKSFDDDLDTLVMRRLGGLVPGGYTRLGAAIRHGAFLVEDRGGTSRRLLVVLSDGLAYDHGYAGRYGEADSRHALAEARRTGTGCLCLGFGAGADLEPLRRVFGTAAHATVARPDQLASVIGPLFRSALEAGRMA